MPRTPANDVHPVLPGCEPWSSPGGGPHGALVLHGFTGSPVSMRPLAEDLAEAGFAVEMPRLPGHGTNGVVRPRRSSRRVVSSPHSSSSRSRSLLARSPL